MSALGPKALALVASLAADQPTISATELSCLALNVYHEARGEPMSGQAAVAAVTMRRVELPRYPDTVCGVVYQSKQFSWTWDRKPDRPTDWPAIRAAIFIGLDVMTGSLAPAIGGATHYFAPAKVKKRPRWTREFAQVASIGGHRFHKED